MQRRHEAELKLNGAEGNLTRVDDVIEQLAAQLAQLARQARQAARYREIGDELRRTEGMLLYRRWREADDARASTEEELRVRVRRPRRLKAPCDRRPRRARRLMMFCRPCARKKRLPRRSCSAFRCSAIRLPIRNCVRKPAD